MSAPKDDPVSEYMSKIGRAGGQSTSEKKAAAARRNIKKAKRWPKKKK